MDNSRLGTYHSMNLLWKDKFYLFIKKAKVAALFHIKCASQSEDLCRFKTEETFVKITNKRRLWIILNEKNIIKNLTIWYKNLIQIMKTIRKMYKLDTQIRMQVDSKMQ